MTSPKQSPDAVVVSEVVATYAHLKEACRVLGGECPHLEPALAKALATIEHNARPRWIPVSTELPDSDVRVLVRHIGGDVLTVELEFTDDSEGHGKPYWSDYGRALAIDHYPHWMGLPDEPPPPTGASDA